MTSTGELDLRLPAELTVNGGTLCTQGTQLLLATPSGSTQRKEIPGLGRSDYAAYWTDGERLLLVGLRDRGVVFADPRASVLDVIGELDRLDLYGAYDPGGLERVRFIDMSPKRIAVVFELGVAVVDLLDRSLVWQRTHDDIQAVCIGVSEGALWFEGEHGRFGFRAEDGEFIAE